MRALAFSDLHCDLGQAAELVRMSADADVVIGAGDFASVHDRLTETIDALSAIEAPTVLVPGNNETEDALRDAAKSWPAATVLHGEATDVDGTTFYGLGAGIPVTPWDWSFDLSDEEAEPLLAKCPHGAVMVVHSPPLGHVDVSGAGQHLGSAAILEAIETKAPPLVVCGHIHESWGSEAQVQSTRIINLGPHGTWLDL
jgi:Icc-related predicted phosphoesterase